MANTIIFIDNYDSFTYNLVDELRVLDNNVLVYRNDTDVELIAKIANEYKAKGDKVIIMLSPGPSSPNDANNLIPIIKDNLGKYPMLGIVHGKSSMMTHDGRLCFEGMPMPLKIARYHSLVVEDLPSDVEVLATYDNMVMSLYSAKYNVLGFQFHPESVMTTFGRNLLKNAIASL